MKLSYTAGTTTYEKHAQKKKPLKDITTQQHQTYDTA